MNIQNLIPWGRDNDVTERVPRAYEGGRDPFLALHRDINRLFDETLRGFGLPALAGRTMMGAWPNMEIRDGEKELRVVAELPGMTDDDVEILLADNALVLRGEKRDETEDKDRRFSERFYGRFERRIPLDVEIEQDGVRADFKDGVLTVTLPKSERAQSQVRRIEVRKAT